MKKYIPINSFMFKFKQRLTWKIYKCVLTEMGLDNDSDMHNNGELNVLKLIRSKNPIIFDVGANSGEWSREVLKKIHARLFAFEPSRLAFKKLEKNIRANIFNIGFGDKEEIRTLYNIEPGSEMGSVYKRNVNGLDFHNYTEEVQIKTLDKFCADNNIREIDFLKIDVEGHELSVLAGAKEMLDKTKLIQFEFGCNLDSRTFLKDFYNLLKNYDFYRITKNGFVGLGYYQQKLELFGYANYLCVLKNYIN